MRSRKDSNRLSSGTNDYTDYTDYLDRLNRAPRLDLKWFHNADGTGESEILRVSNLGSVSVEVLRIASLQTRDAIATDNHDPAGARNMGSALQFDRTRR